MYRSALLFFALCVFLAVPMAAQAESLPPCDEIDNLAHCLSVCQSYVALSSCANISQPAGYPSCRIFFTCRAYSVIPVDPFAPISMDQSKEDQLSCTDAPAGTFIVYEYCGCG